MKLKIFNTLIIILLFNGLSWGQDIDITSAIPNGPFCYNDTFSITYKYHGSIALKTGNEFSVYSYDSLGNTKTKLGSLKTTSTTGSILVTILNSDVVGYKLRVQSSSPVTYSAFSDTFTIKKRVNVSFKIHNYSLGDTARCFKGNVFYFDVVLTDTGQATTKIWYFGDGDSSLQWKPAGKSYSTQGNYKIQLKAYNAGYACATISEQSVYVRPNPKASFTVSNPSVCEKDTITYTNTSVSSGESLFYNWTLSGSYIKGTSSTTKDAVQYYPADYSFNAKLITRNLYGCADTTSPIIIKASKYPSPSFLLDSLKPCFNGNKVLLTNRTTVSSSLPKNLTYLWDFGDGKTSTAESPLKSYDSIGSKKIKLTATNNGSCSSSFSRTLIIQPNPVADFAIDNDTQCFNEHQFIFTNKSQAPNGNTITSSWNVGSVSSTLSSPTIKLTKAGNYAAQLTVKTAIGCSDSVKKNIVINPSPQPVISGVTSAYGKNQSAYTVPLNIGSTYVWAVSGGTIFSGQNTNQIKVKWDENTGSVGQVFLIETNSFGCAGAPSVVVVNLDPSNINGIENIHNISLYPNPASNELMVNAGNYTGQYSITIFNNLGQTVIHRSGLIENGLLQLDEFTAGVYFVQIEGANFSYNQKLVIHK